MLEERRICAFIDILGFKNEILYSDDERRAKIIQLVQKISNEDSEQSLNTESFDYAQFSYPSAEVTSFSDNIVISTSLQQSVRNVQVGHEIIPMTESPAKFIEHIFIKIISVYWEALHLGLLFRGGITVGNLYHKSRVVVGEALITAYELEGATSYPRIEVSYDVVELINSMDEIIEKETLFIKQDGKYFVNTLGFHMGVWRDYAYYNKIEQLEYKTIIEIVDNIIEKAEATYQKHIANNNEKVSQKWKWFLDSFKEQYNKGYWLQIKENVAQSTDDK